MSGASALRLNKDVFGYMSKDAKRRLFEYLSNRHTKSFLTERLRERLVSIEFPGVQITFFGPDDLNDTLDLLETESLKVA